VAHAGAAHAASLLHSRPIGARFARARARVTATLSLKFTERERDDLYRSIPLGVAYRKSIRKTLRAPAALQR